MVEVLKVVEVIPEAVVDTRAAAVQAAVFSAISWVESSAVAAIQAAVAGVAEVEAIPEASEIAAKNMNAPIVI